MRLHTSVWKQWQNANINYQNNKGSWKWDKRYMYSAIIVMSTDEWKYGHVNNIAQTRHFRQGLVIAWTAPARTTRSMGRHRTGYLTIHQRSLLDPLYRCTIARPAFLLWKLEQCCQALQALGRARCMGSGTWMYYWWFRLVDEWSKPSQGSSPCSRCCWWKPGHGTYKRVLNTKIHLVYRSECLLQRVSLLTVHRDVPWLTESLPGGYRATRVMTATQSPQKLLSRICASLFLRRRAGVFNGSMIDIFTAYAIRLKTPFRTSNAGAELPLVMQSAPHPSLPLSKSCALPCGQMFWHNRVHNI